MNNAFFRNLPVINVCISYTALLFQIGVLYPRHKQISNQINNIEYVIKNKA
jgi:hypothetical protein